MHELSIAHRLVEIVTEHANQADQIRVQCVTLRIGRLSCVHQDALRFSFDLVAQGTPLEGAELKVVDVPVVIFCPNCDRTVELPGIQNFRCPRCDTLSGDIRQGRELDIETIHLGSAAV